MKYRMENNNEESQNEAKYILYTWSVVVVTTREHPMNTQQHDSKTDRTEKTLMESCSIFTAIILKIKTK